MFGWATNPETGTHHVVLTSVKGEKQTTRKIHQEIVTFYGGAPAFVFGAASHASEEGMPLDDGVFVSSIGTLCEMRPAEYPLAEPYRVKILAAAADTRLEDYARDMPVEKFEKEQLRLLNAMYPKGEPEPGELFRSCSEARVLPASSPPRALIRRTDHVNFPGGVPRTPGPQGKRQRT